MLRGAPTSSPLFKTIAGIRRQRMIGPIPLSLTHRRCTPWKVRFLVSFCAPPQYRLGREISARRSSPVAIQRHQAYEVLPCVASFYYSLSALIVYQHTTYTTNVQP